jgi:hypothetical protein
MTVKELIDILSQQNQRQTLAQIKIPVQFQTHPEFLKLELENCPTNIELIQYRTADQRTFLDIEGNYHTQKTGGYYNYLKESQWISIQEKLSFNQNLNSILILIPIFQKGVTRLGLVPINSTTCPIIDGSLVNLLIFKKVLICINDTVVCTNLPNPFCIIFEYLSEKSSNDNLPLI